MIEPSDLNLTPIRQIGEFGLIHRLTQKFTVRHPKRVLCGVGDDCAVLDFNATQAQLVSTDILMEGIHFDLTYVPLKHLGYKAIAVNISDVLAMNGTPTAVTVGIAVSNRFSVEALEEMYRGIHIACEEFNIDLIGGDTASSRSGLGISVTVMGLADHNQVVYRSGAKEMDILCVTGDVGSAYAGLQLLEREKQIFNENPNIQPDFSSFEYVVERQLRPHLRQDVIRFFHRAGIVPTSMIDVSDGVASEVHHLCRQSGTGATIYQDKLPIDYQTQKTAELFDIPAVNFALFGGEDYELLFTIRQSDYNRVLEHPLIRPIGHMTAADQGVNLVLTNGSITELRALGFNHFEQ
jgi:thiamine-monophosphate kinase